MLTENDFNINKDASANEEVRERVQIVRIDVLFDKGKNHDK